jgi:hypothetical protein
MGDLASEDRNAPADSGDPPLREVLVVSPHFPPTDAVDMHRVRMTVGHYRANGWRPIVLCVRAEDADRPVDPGLCDTLPAGLEVIAVRAPKAVFGLTAMGIRAWRALEREGRRILAERPVELVFISTTAFPIMAIGRAWKRRFGTPFVLDFQDPWATFPASAAPFHRRGPKHAAMRLVHRWLERRTVPEAAGLISVSPVYVELLRKAYPALRDRPALVSEFGYSNADMAAARSLGRPSPALERREGERVCLFAGRVAPAMEGAVRALFHAIAEELQRSPEALRPWRFVFIGTGYAKAGNPQVVTGLAAEAGIADRVSEHSDRIPFLDALASMMQADAVLVLGSDDEGYIPSKLRSCLALGKPLLCVAPKASRLAAAVAGLESVVRVLIDSAPSSEDWPSRLADRKEAEAFVERVGLTAPFEAAACAARDCGLLDAAVVR